MKTLLPSERVAVGVFVGLLALSFLQYPLYQTFSIFGVLVVFLIWLIVLLLALFHVGFAFRDPHPSLSHRLRAAFAIPVGVGLLLLLQLWVAPAPRIMAALHMATYSEQMVLAQRAAGPGRPAAITYVEGIPDGGIAIVRSDIDPSKLPPSEQLRLINEEISRCRTIPGDAWVCWFD